MTRHQMKQFWMEIRVEAGLVNAAELDRLLADGDEILRIVVSRAKTARSSCDA